MTYRILALLLLSAMLGSNAFALNQYCAQIETACTTAGFVQNEGKIGKGLWVDCINPIMQHTVAKKAKLALPKVDATTIANCAQGSPKFGMGKIGN